MCFIVVLSHFWTSPSMERFIDLFFDIRPVAVPVFMLISFYLVSDSIINVRAEWAKKRMFRLIWPQVAYALVYWIILFPKGKACLADLFWQIFYWPQSSVKCNDVVSDCHDCVHSSVLFDIPIFVPSKSCQHNHLTSCSCIIFPA